MKRAYSFWNIALSALVLTPSVVIVSAGFFHSAAAAQIAAAQGGQSPASAPSAIASHGSAPAQPATAAGRPLPAWQGAQLRRLSPRAELYYEGIWGVGELHVKVAESGELIRFNYRVLDPNKAATLNDKKAEPALLDAEGGVKLSVPEMEKVGKLRQQSTPKAGMTYWMAFSNPTLAVKRGHWVDVVIGHFHADGLLVE